MSDEDLTYVSTESLLDELAKRHPVMAFAGYKYLTRESNGLTVDFRGDHPSVIGLVQIMDKQALVEFLARWNPTSGDPADG